MAYLVHCLYRPGGANDRLGIRRAHIEHMLNWLPLTVFGSAILGEDSQPAGMVVALDVSSAEEAQRFLEAEPYFQAGLFEKVSINALVQMTPPHTRDFLERELAKCA